MDQTAAVARDRRRYEDLVTMEKSACVPGAGQSREFQLESDTAPQLELC
jgi:hypothetical protein